MNQDDVFEAAGVLFVIPALDTGVFDYAVQFDFFFSAVFVPRFSANPDHVAGGVTGFYQLPPATETVR